MMNLSILALSMTSIYSPSPIFVGFNMNIQKLNIKYFFPTILFNPEELFLEKSQFSYGIVPLLISKKHIDMPAIGTVDYHDRYYSNSNFSNIDMSISGRTFMRDCHFMYISVIDNYPMMFFSQSTLYVMNCVFSNCRTYNSVFNIQTRGTTISHICCSDLSATSSVNNKILFIDANLPSDTFFQFYYSTITGTNEDSFSSSICEFIGNTSMRYQCINMSNFVNENNVVFFKIPNCLNAKMNTFYNLKASTILNFIIENSNNQLGNCYVSNSNFVKNQFNEKSILLNMVSNSIIYFDSCVFSLNSGSQLFDKNDSDSIVYILNCVFDTDISFSVGFHVVNKIISINPLTNTLVHFITENICQGEIVENAYGCNDNSCPDQMGCPTGVFTFINENYGYTLRTYPEFKSPIIQSSSHFTKSLIFTPSNDFDHTNTFSPSNTFDSTKKFSNSFIFTMSSEFDDLIPFYSTTFVKKFSSTLDFTNSNHFLVSQTKLTQSLKSQTISISITQSFVLIKSVTFSVSYLYSNSYYECNDANNVASICVNPVYDKYIIPYIIHFLSPTFVPVYLSFDLKNPKKKISQEQLIGAVCGSVAIFFAILGVVILFYRKKKKDIFILNEFDDLSESVSSDSLKETNIKTINMTNDKFDDWM